MIIYENGFKVKAKRVIIFDIEYVMREEELLRDLKYDTDLFSTDRVKKRYSSDGVFFIEMESIGIFYDLDKSDRRLVEYLFKIDSKEDKKYDEEFEVIVNDEFFFNFKEGKGCYSFEYYEVYNKHFDDYKVKIVSDFYNDRLDAIYAYVIEEIESHPMFYNVKDELKKEIF